MNPTSIQMLTDEDLITSTEQVVEKERKIVQVVIWHLQELQNRKLFLKMGYVSLYECLIKHFKMSDTTAYGRIKVLKILNDVPEVSESLKTGELNISSIALASSFIEKHQKSTGEVLQSSDRAELIENLKNKTTSEVKELLASYNPEMALPYDEIKFLTESHCQMKSTVSKGLVKKLEYLKSLISHDYTNPTHEELLALAFDALIEKAEKKKGIFRHKKEDGPCAQIKLTDNAQPITKMKMSEEVRAVEGIGSIRETVSESESASTATLCLTDGSDIEIKKQKMSKGSRYISVKIKRQIFKRAQGQCEHVHENGIRCGSTFQTQFDHIIPFSKNGPATFENIQLLCRNHNAYKGDRLQV